MRSKEVDDAIMYIQDHLDFFITEKVNIERDLVETLLAYISELEEENLTQRSQLNSAFDNGFIHKDKIRDKIKELEKELDEFEKTDNSGRFKREKSRDYDIVMILKELLEGE